MQEMVLNMHLFIILQLSDVKSVINLNHLYTTLFYSHVKPNLPENHICWDSHKNSEMAVMELKNETAVCLSSDDLMRSVSSF